MAVDFVARLGSRGTVPGEVRSAGSVPQYVDLMAPRPGLDAELRRLARRARSLRRIDPDRLLAVLRAVADPPAAELNKARVAAVAGIPATTLTSYLDVLETLGLIRMLPGCRSPVAKRPIGRPVLVLPDPGLALHLAGLTSGELVAFSGRARLAPLLRGIAAAELLRQQESSAVPHRISHLRERNGLQVDIVVEFPDGSVYGIEVRTAASLRPHQFVRLEALAARAGSAFRGGVVLNTASVGHQYRPGMWGLPVSALWE